MGQRQLSLVISNQKPRRTIVFEKRAKNLKKKAYELSTLCQVPLCVIIYAGQDSSEPADIWPPDSSQFRQILRRYLDCSKEDRTKRAQNLLDVVSSAKKPHLFKLLQTGSRDNNAVGGSSRADSSNGLKYPGWIPDLDRLDKDQLLEVAFKLNRKIERVKNRVQVLRNQRDAILTLPPLPPPSSQPLPALQHRQSLQPPTWANNLFSAGNLVNFNSEGNYKPELNESETFNFNYHPYISPGDNQLTPYGQSSYNQFSDQEIPLLDHDQYYSNQADYIHVSDQAILPWASSIDQAASTPTTQQTMMCFTAGGSSSCSSLPTSSLDPEASIPTIQQQMIMGFKTGASSSSSSIPSSSSFPTMQQTMLDIVPYDNTGVVENNNDDDNGYFSMTNYSSALPPSTLTLYNDQQVTSMIMTMPISSYDSVSGEFSGNDMDNMVWTSDGYYCEGTSHCPPWSK